MHRSADLPRGWPKLARAALVQLLGIARVALTRTRARCADSRLVRERLRGRVDQLEHEVALLREELRIKERAWCKKHGVRPRFGAVGQHGSIAVVERFIRSMKQEAFARILVPMSLRLLTRELDAYLVWYHEDRPHYERRHDDRGDGEHVV